MAFDKTLFDAPTRYMASRERYTVVAKFRADHPWAKDFNVQPLLKEHPDMSVRDAFDRLREEDRKRRAEERKRLRALQQHMFAEPYRALNEHERIQLRVLLESEGRGDVADALVDNPSYSADRIRDMIADGAWDKDMEHDWLPLLPCGVDVGKTHNTTLRRFLDSLREHRGQWRMWASLPEPELAYTAGQVLKARAGVGYDVKTKTYRADGTTGVFAMRP